MHALDCCDINLSRLRALASIHHPTLFEVDDTLLKLVCPARLSSIARSTPTYDTKLEHFLDDLDYDDFHVEYLDDPLTLGIGLYNDLWQSVCTTSSARAITSRYSSRDTHQFQRRPRCVELPIATKPVVSKPS